jgi:hypothetical protein
MATEIAYGVPSGVSTPAAFEMSGTTVSGLAADQGV